MGLARRVLEKVPQFNVELGPGVLGYYGDSLFALQLLAAGYRILAVRNAEVEHHFDADRLKSASVISAARKMGQSEAYVHHHWRQGTILTYNWWHAIRQTAVYTLYRIFRPARWACEENPPYWALHAIMAYWFTYQYHIEKKKPRAYTRMT
jgi:hypothetical protein